MTNPNLHGYTGNPCGDDFPMGIGDTTTEPAPTAITSCAGGHSQQPTTPEPNTTLITVTVTVTCTYADADADADTVTTRFNGSPPDAHTYFVGHTFTIGSVDDNMQRCVSITIHDGKQAAP